MRRYLSALLGMCLLVSMNGCVTTAVGGGTTAATGTYSYFTRELEVIYGVPLADVWPRALAAIESLQLHIDRQLIDGKSEYGQCESGCSAHRIDVADRIRG